MSQPFRNELDVGGLQVSVDHALTVGFVDGFGTVTNDLDFLGERQLGKGSFQGISVHKLHGDVGSSVNLSYLEDFADRWMIDACLGAGFTLEAGHHFRVGTANELQRDSAAKTAIFGLEDDPHAALSKHGQELIAIPVFHRNLQILAFASSSGQMISGEGLVAAEVIRHRVFFVVGLHADACVTQLISFAYLGRALSVAIG